MKVLRSGKSRVTRSRRRFRSRDHSRLWGTAGQSYLRRLCVEPLEDRRLLARLFAVPNDGSDDIVELDPATAAEMNRFDAPPVSGGPDGLAFNGSSLFFLNGSATLWELNPDTGAVLDFDLLTVGSGGYDGLAALRGRVYILDYAWDDILQFDPVSDTVTDVLDIDGLNPGVTKLIGGLAGITGPDALIVTEGPSTVLEIDPVSGFVSNSFALPGSAYYGVAVVDG